jgi:cytochrome c551/c552
MEFLDKLVILQPEQDLHLLNYLLMLGMLIFFVYSGLLFGSSFLSIFFRTKKYEAIKERLALDYIDLVNPNSMIGFGLGVSPMLAIIFLYTQLLHDTIAPVVGYLVIAFLLYIIALALIYLYRHSLHLGSILHITKKADNIDHADELELNEFKKTNTNINKGTAIWGIIFLFFSMWIFIAATVAAADPAQWAENSGFFAVISTFGAIAKSLQFFTASLAITGVALITKVFYWDKNPHSENEEYAAYAKNYNASIAMIFTLVQPIFFVLNVIVTPKEALSYTLFGASIGVLVIVIITAHLLYVQLKHKRYSLSKIGFYLLIVAFGFVVVKEQAAFNISNNEHIENLAVMHDALELEKLKAAGQFVEIIDGAEIYEARCTACHGFDERKQGPPHKEVLPKYLNDQEALVRFILKPAKINPDYPSMPPPGLKPKEAKAVAEFMIEHYGPKLKK